MALWGIVFMGLVLALLAAALQPTGYVLSNPDTGQEFKDVLPNRQIYLSSAAICFFSERGRVELTETLAKQSHRSYSGGKHGPPYNLSFILISLSFLVVGHLKGAIRVSYPAAQILKVWLHVAPIDFICTVYGAPRRRPF